MINVIKSKRLRTEARAHFAVFAHDAATVDLLVEAMLDVVHGMHPKDEEEGSLFLEVKCREYIATFGGQLAAMTAAPSPKQRGLRFTHADSRKANALVQRCLATAGTIATLCMLAVGCGACGTVPPPAVPVTFTPPTCLDTHEDGSAVAHTLHLGLKSDGPAAYRLEVDGDGETYLLPAREIDGTEYLKAKIETGIKRPWRDVKVRVATLEGETWRFTDTLGPLGRCVDD